MNQQLGRWVLTLMSWCGAFGASARAVACGGEFGPPGPPQPGAVATPVTGHRMAFAVSDERTVLWDQIKYEGAPADFSWVLPVRPNAYLEASRDSWFEALDAVTTTRVSAPVLKCVPPEESAGCGCGAGGDDDSGTFESDGGNKGVTVLHQGTVGPYETVTLASTDGDTLSTWLVDHGYSVPDDVAPIISEYVFEGFDFIALRLKAGASVQQMTPVRVVTPGPRGALPLRMVAAGVGASVEISLYLIGESRFGLPDLHESTLDVNALRWDFKSGQTNYASLQKSALTESFGASFVTTFADQGAFSRAYSDADGAPLRYQVGATTVATLSALYFGLSGQQAGSSPFCPSLDAAFATPAPVSEAGQAGSQPAANFICSEFDDISAAVIGMRPPQVWLTRVDMNLPRSALSADCIVEPNASQASVSNAVRAVKFTNPPDDCVLPIFETGLVAKPRRDALLWLAVVAYGLVARLRRRRSRA